MAQSLKPWTLFFVVIYIAMSQISLDLYLPSLPKMVSVFHTSDSLVQLSIAIYLIGIAASQFFYGPLSDSYGRKPVVLTGCILFVVGSFICCISQNIDSFLFGRLVQGMGLGFGSIMSRAILRDCVSDKKLIAKYVSLQSMCWSVVPLVAPVVGGYVGHWLSWRANFIILLVMGLFLLFSSFFKLEETRAVENRQPFHIFKLIKNYILLLRRFHLSAYMLIIAFQYGSVMTVLQLSPFIFQQSLGYSPYIYGWMILVIGAGSFIGSFVNKTVSQYFEIKHILLVALFSSILFVIVMNLLAISWFNAWVILVPLFLMRLFGGLIYSSSITEGLAQYPEHSGSISALYGIVITLGGAIISAIVSHIPQYKQWTLSGSLLVELICGLLVFLLALLVARRN